MLGLAELRQKLQHRAHGEFGRNSSRFRVSTRRTSGRTRTSARPLQTMEQGERRRFLAKRRRPVRDGRAGGFRSSVARYTPKERKRRAMPKQTYQKRTAPGQ